MFEAQPTSVLAIVRGYAMRMKSAPPRPQKVLVVDDEDLVRKFVERVLREGGYQTTTASDGPEALEAAAAETFDVLVTDVMMPQMTGDELARRVRVTTPAIKVLYLTGFSDRLFKEKVTLWADEAFLDKPCSVKGLLQAVSLLVFGRFELPQEHRS
ncbi:MAG: putative multi-sensor signal transduction histidine kinase [Acidobacteria bacterium]|nr:putative multi-sensor signal transduction histidine kinase [Acidobacteriota bacterium]